MPVAPIVPIQPPSLVEPLPFPTMADHELGTYNSKAYAWAGRHPYVADAMTGQADATYQNAMMVVTAIDALNIDAEALQQALAEVNTAVTYIEGAVITTGQNVTDAQNAAIAAQQSAEDAAESAATVSLGPLTARVEALESAIGGSGALMPKAGGTFTGAVNFNADTYNNFGSTVAVGGFGSAAGALSVKALSGTAGISFFKSDGAGIGRIRVNVEGGDGIFDLTNAANNAWGGIRTGTAEFFGVNVAAYGALHAGTASAGLPDFNTYGAGLHIPTSNKFGVHFQHTGVMLLTSMNGWGTATLNCWGSTGWGTYDTGSPIFQFGKPGSTITTANLILYGNQYVTGNIIGYYTSDRKHKENIKPIEQALDKVLLIGGKTFTWKQSWLKRQSKEARSLIKVDDIGVIAQDVQNVLPEAVYTRKDGTLAVAYPKLIGLAFQAIVELVRNVRNMNARLEALERKA